MNRKLAVRIALVAGSIVLVVTAVSLLSYREADWKEPATADGATTGSGTIARREDFRSVIDATGDLEAVVSNQLGPPSIPDTWNYNLTWMANEGGFVRSGDAVMKFDGTVIEDKLRQSQTDFETASKEREKQEKSLEVEVEQLKLNLVEERSTLARAELEAQVPEGLISSLDAQELKLKEKLAREKVSYLEAKIKARSQQVAAQLKLLDVKKQRAKQLIDYYQASLSKFAVKAPSDGVVIYVRKRDGGRYEIGDSVWMLSKVVEVADLTTLRVSAALLEVDATRVRPGQTVSVTVDAIPGKVWKSDVSDVGKLVRPRSEKDPGKVFDVHIPLRDIDRKSMRPGMSVQVEIEESMLPGAITIPVGAIRDRNGAPIVRVDGPKGPEERAIKVGPRNRDRIVVLEGLREGEKLL